MDTEQENTAGGAEQSVPQEGAENVEETTLEVAPETTDSPETAGEAVEPEAV